MLCTRAECNLPCALKGKPIFANKGTKSLNFLYPLLYLLLCHQDSRTFSQFQETGYLIRCLGNPLLCLFADVYMYMSLHTTPAKLKWMELLLTPFLQAAQGSLPSAITFRAFSVPFFTISIIFIIECYAPFQVSSLPFIPSKCFNYVKLST